MNINNDFISILVKDIIDTSIKNIVEKNFYLIKHCSIKNKYICSEILYKNVLENFSESNHSIKDLLEIISNNLDSILPIPILNGKYLRTNYTINKLPSKLIIVFVNMNIVSYQTILPPENSINYIMNFINNNIDIGDMIQNSNFTIPALNIPPPPNTPYPNTPLSNHPIPHPPPLPINIPFPLNLIPVLNTNNSFINENKEKYKDEITILQNMGFSDENKIIESLIVSNGDINNSINYYLQQ